MRGGVHGEGATALAAGRRRTLRGAWWVAAAACGRDSRVAAKGSCTSRGRVDKRCCLGRGRARDGATSDRRRPTGGPRAAAQNSSRPNSLCQSVASTGTAMEAAS